MPETDPILEELVKSVRAGARYQAISIDLVRQVGRQELAKVQRLKEAVKNTRSKLHQVAVAYQESPIPYNRHLEALSTLPARLDDPALQDFCRKVMKQHTSTAERLPILEIFFQTILAPLPPVHSGLTPLALPWMPVTADVRYDACDIYSDMLDFINRFFNHIGQPGLAAICDLTQAVPEQQVDVAFLLKSVPCLEQLDKQIVTRLLQQIPARYIVVSFPDRSLGGRQKGMAQFYRTHFETLVQHLPFELQYFTFPGEIAYLLSRRV